MYSFNHMDQVLKKLKGIILYVFVENYFISLNNIKDWTTIVINIS